MSPSRSSATGGTDPGINAPWVRGRSLGEPEPVEGAAVLLGRPAGTGVTGEVGEPLLLGRGRRAVVDEGLGGHRGADPLLDDPEHLHDTLPAVEMGLHPIADAEG